MELEIVKECLYLAINPNPNTTFHISAHRHHIKAQALPAHKQQKQQNRVVQNNAMVNRHRPQRMRRHRSSSSSSTTSPPPGVGLPNQRRRPRTSTASSATIIMSSPRMQQPSNTVHAQHHIIVPFPPQNEWLYIYGRWWITHSNMLWTRWYHMYIDESTYEWISWTQWHQ